MSKPLDNRVKQILKKLDLDPKECLWLCHNTWIMLHKYVEQVGAKYDIRYEFDEIETNSAEGIVCIKCTADIKTKENKKDTFKTVVTYGEASPKNYRTKLNQPSYPYAMAEKRAYDRAVLKLVGLHGFIYSEDEMDHSEKKEGINAVTELAKELTPEEEQEGKKAAFVVTSLINDGFDWKAYDYYQSLDMEVRTALWNEIQGMKSQEKGGNGQYLTYTGILKKYHEADERGERPDTIEEPIGENSYGI